CLRAGAKHLARIGDVTVRVACARDHGAVRGVDDVADRVDGDDGADDQAVRQGDRRGSDPRLHRHAAAANLADRRAGARADVSFSDRTAGGSAGSLIATLRCRPRLVSAEPEVEQDRRRHDGNDTGAGLEADVLFLEVLHDALRRVEAKRAAAGEDNRVHALDEIGGIEQVGLARAGRTAALCDAADGAITVREHHRATRQPAGQREVAHPDAWHLRNALALGTRCLAVRCHRGRRDNRKQCRCPHRRPDYGGTQITLSMSRVPPTQMAPAAITGPSMRSTGCIARGSTTSRYSNRTAGSRSTTCLAAWRTHAASRTPSATCVLATVSASYSTVATRRSSGCSRWLRELSASPSGSRTVGTPTISIGTLKSATMRRITASCCASFSP